MLSAVHINFVDEVYIYILVLYINSKLLVPVTLACLVTGHPLPCFYTFLQAHRDHSSSLHHIPSSAKIRTHKE